MNPPHTVDVEIVDIEVGLSLAEAARRYGMSPRTLSQRVRLGEIRAYKARGLRGQEWRVLASELERCGYVAADGTPAVVAVTPELAASEAHVRTLEGQLAAERRHSALLDQRLGAALIECGRLRGQLERAPAPAIVDLTKHEDSAVPRLTPPLRVSEGSGTE